MIIIAMKTSVLVILNRVSIVMCVMMDNTSRAGFIDAKTK